MEKEENHINIPDSLRNTYLKNGSAFLRSINLTGAIGIIGRNTYNSVQYGTKMLQVFTKKACGTTYSYSSQGLRNILSYGGSPFMNGLRIIQNTTLFPIQVIVNINIYMHHNGINDSKSRMIQAAKLGEYCR